MRRRLISLLVILCMGMSIWACPCAVYGSSVSWKTGMTKTESYIGKQLTKPCYGNEWAVIAMARDGGAVKAGAYDTYYKDVEAKVKAGKGVLDARKALPYTKVIMALTAIDRNPENVGGYNLLEGLADFDKVMMTGTNGPIFALLALDSGKYEIPTVSAGKTQTTRDLLVDTILDRELDGGGFTVGMSTNGPETDITAMAIQALAPYRNRPDVAAVIDRGLQILSKKQGSDGCFSDYGTKSCESIAQVMLALIALDIDPLIDSRFVKNGNTLMDALMIFYDTGGGFKHVLKTTAGYEAPVNGMATEQGYLVLGAYKRFLAGENFVYD
ncbi:MAG: terpene cyclase/mutase family protein, partial [Firmicutes bacterium]|nr:terpene cyclase/mutase family protein [Bacillota bacterium]